MNVRPKIGVKITGKLKATGIRLGSMKVLCPFDIPPNPNFYKDFSVTRTSDPELHNREANPLPPSISPLPPSPPKNTAHEEKELEKI